MEKKYALIISFMVTFVFLGNYLFFHDFSRNLETVIVGRVLDGDTLETEDGRTIRLVNLNTPERKEFGYESAKEFLSTLKNRSIGIEVIGRDSYGRDLARIYSPEYVNLKIIEEGFGHVFLVQENELKEFKSTQEKSFAKQKGIWERSEFYGCINLEINKKEEYVLIELSCDVNLKGWTLKDESTRKYTFKQDYEDLVILYSAEGIDHENELYWGRGNAWNDDRDSVFIRDQEGFLVFYDSYGY